MIGATKQDGFRTGIGYDVHRLEEGNPFYLGGIEISFHAGPVAHSDGDVLLHTLGDACLGAAGLGDLGTHFPDNSEEWEGVSGNTVISRILDFIADRGLSVFQLDSIVVLERPRISKYRDDITSNLSELFSIPSSRVGFKVTTNEGLGPIGNGEAVAAWGNVLLTEQ